MEPIDAGDIPLEAVVSQVFTESGLRTLLGEYEVACFVLARASLQPAFYHNLIENIDMVDDTTREKIAFVVFHGSKSSFVIRDDNQPGAYRFQLDGLSLSRKQNRLWGLDKRSRRRTSPTEFSEALRNRLKRDPEVAPFAAIARATSLATSMLMDRYEIRDTALPCLLFVAQYRMNDPVIVRLSADATMVSLYREVLAPLSDEFRIFDGIAERRDWISTYPRRLENAKNVVGAFPAQRQELEASLRGIRAEIDEVLAGSASERSPLEAEIENLEALRRAFKATSSLDERVRLSPPTAAITARMAAIVEQMRAHEDERKKIDYATADIEEHKRISDLSSSINKLRSTLGSLAGIPYTDAGNRIEKLKSLINKLEAPARQLRVREHDIRRKIERLQADYDSAKEMILADANGVLGAEQTKLRNAEEQLRLKGFSDNLIRNRSVPVIDIISFLSDKGIIGHTVPGEVRAIRAPAILTALSPKALVLFIHGLGGGREATWGKLPDYLMADEAISRGFEIDFYSFPTQLIRLPFFPRSPKIQVLADGLRTQIKYSGFDRINLLCHSLGGLIAKQYLIEEADAKRELNVDRLALLAVPNNGAELAALAQFISFRQAQIKQLCREADIIELANKAWQRLEMQKRVRVKYVVGSQDRVVSRRSAEEFWGNPDLETITGSGHIDIVKPKRPDDLVVKMVRTFLLD